MAPTVVPIVKTPPVVADTVVKHTDAPVVVNIPKPQPVVKPHPVVVDTVIKHKEAPVAASIPKPQSIVDSDNPPPIEPKHVIVVSSQALTPPPKPQPAIQVEYIPEKSATTGEKPEVTTEGDFAKLKADLDKVVYADDTKLVAKIEVDRPKAQLGADQPPEGVKYYTVKKGDTAFSIAKKNNISVNDLLKLNSIPASGVKAGKNLRVK